MQFKQETILSEDWVKVHSTGGDWVVGMAELVSKNCIIMSNCLTCGLRSGVCKIKQNLSISLQDLSSSQLSQDTTLQC